MASTRPVAILKRAIVALLGYIYKSHKLGPYKRRRQSPTPYLLCKQGSPIHRDSLLRYGVACPFSYYHFKKVGAILLGPQYTRANKFPSQASASEVRCFRKIDEMGSGVK